MGRNAKRRRIIRRPVRQLRRGIRNSLARDEQQARVELSEHARALVEKVWAMPILKRVVPEGEDPIATKCDPARMQLHIACASGKSFVVSLDAMEAADAAPRIILP